MAISKITEAVVNETGPIFEKEYQSKLSEMGRNFGNFFASVRKEGLEPRGYMYCTYLTDPNDVKDGIWTYKISVVVNQESPKTIVYPEHKVLKLTVTGSYKQFSEAYTQLGNYVKLNKKEVVAPPYEVYIKGPKFGFIMIGLESEVRFPIN